MSRVRDWLAACQECVLGPVITLLDHLVPRWDLTPESPAMASTTPPVETGAEWTVWATGTDSTTDQPDLATALMTAAEDNAAYAAAHDGHLLSPVQHAVVLHNGRPWQRHKPAVQIPGQTELPT